MSKLKQMTDCDWQIEFNRLVMVKKRLWKLIRVPSDFAAIAAYAQTLTALTDVQYAMVEALCLDRDSNGRKDCDCEECRADPPDGPVCVQPSLADRVARLEARFPARTHTAERDQVKSTTTTYPPDKTIHPKDRGKGKPVPMLDDGIPVHTPDVAEAFRSFKPTSSDKFKCPHCGLVDDPPAGPPPSGDGDRFFCLHCKKYSDEPVESTPSGRDGMVKPEEE